MVAEIKKSNLPDIFLKDGIAEGETLRRIQQREPTITSVETNPENTTIILNNDFLGNLVQNHKDLGELIKGIRFESSPESMETIPDIGCKIVIRKSMTLLTSGTEIFHLTKLRNTIFL